MVDSTQRNADCWHHYLYVPTIAQGVHLSAKANKRLLEKIVYMVLSRDIVGQDVSQDLVWDGVNTLAAEHPGLQVFNSTIKQRVISI